MKALFHKNFNKQYKKLRAIQSKVDERLILFSKDPFGPILNNHGLAGKYEGCRSINITGDYRAIYELVDDNIAYFIALGTHPDLYK